MPRVCLQPLDTKRLSIYLELPSGLLLGSADAWKRFGENLKMSTDDSIHVWITKDGAVDFLPLNDEITCLDVTKSNWMLCYSISKGDCPQCINCRKKVDFECT